VIVTYNHADLAAMKTAIEAGDIDVVRRLISTRFYVRSAFIVPSEKQTALHLAATFGKAEICRLLLRCGANVRAPNIRGNTPLHCVLGSGVGDVVAAEICAMFIKAGASVNVANVDGITPLAFAAQANELSAALILVGKGSEVMAADDKGVTSLHRAAGSADAQMCKLLLESGAVIDAADESGETPLHRLCNQRSSIGDVRIHDAAEVLIEAGADPEFVPAGMLERYHNVFKTIYLTPFQRAVKMGSLEAIRFFVEEAGVNPAQETLDGRTMEQLAGSFNPCTAELLQALSSGFAISSAIASADADGGRPSRSGGPVL
jgi:ankyrin repeat protein